MLFKPICLLDKGVVCFDFIANHTVKAIKLGFRIMIFNDLV